MTVKSAQAWSGVVVTLDATGALAAASTGPVGVLYVDGTANGATVTITGANPYKWTVTLPTLTVGQCVSMYITATVDSIATAAVVAEDVADTRVASDLATTLGAAGAGLTALGDTRLANLDAAVSSRSTLTAADVWGYATRTLTSLSALLSSIAAAVWAYASRTLTQPAASVLAAVTGSTFNVVKSRTYDATLTGLTIQAAWTGVKFTAKTDAREPDADSLLQVTVSNPAAPTTDGVLYIQGAAATPAQRLQGSLVVDQAAGTVALHLQDDLTAMLALLGGGRYDVTQYYTDGAETKSTQLTRGVWTVSATETAALA